MKDYKIFNVETNPFNIDLISGYLWELEILGINEFDNFIAISVYNDSEVSKSKVETQLQLMVDSGLINSYLVNEEFLKNRNWNDEWEQRTNILEITDQIVIKPSFKKYESDDQKIIITIDPKMSFGTGEHQTTRIVLQLIEKHLKYGNKVLDVGSGTAILGITASKLGAECVLAVDNDEWCYINGIENVKLNEVNNVRVIHGTITDITENDFDLILANINKNILFEIRNDLHRLANKMGKVIVSGILESDLADVERQYIPLGFTALEVKNIDEWIGIVFQKN